MFVAVNDGHGVWLSGVMGKTAFILGWSATSGSEFCSSFPEIALLLAHFIITNSGCIHPHKGEGRRVATSAATQHVQLKFKKFKEKWKKGTLRRLCPFLGNAAFFSDRKSGWIQSRRGSRGAGEDGGVREKSERRVIMYHLSKAVSEIITIH